MVLDDVDSFFRATYCRYFCFPTSKGCSHHFQRVFIVIDNQNVNAGKTLLIAKRDRLQFEINRLP